MLYNIPIEWKSYGLVHVEAENIQEAIQKAIETPFPADWEGVDESTKVDCSYGIRFSNPDLNDIDYSFLDGMQYAERELNGN